MAKLAILLFILVSLCVSTLSAPISCPSAEDLSPCTCLRLAYGLHVTCKNIHRNRDLVRAFKVLRDYKVYKVLLHEVVTTEVLPSDLFDGLDISAIGVERSKLTFSQPAFTGLDESLNILDVAKQSKIKSSENFSLATLTKLTELKIMANPIGKVTDRWLNGKIPNVHKITLDDDNITELEPGCFAKLDSLAEISVADNRIRIVRRSMFPRPARHLTKIDLTGNQISKLPYDFFFEMPKLKEIILSGNDLTTIDQATWTTVWEQLDAVYLSGNKLVCDDRIEWIRRLRWPAQVNGECCVPPESRPHCNKNIEAYFKENQKT